MTTLHLADTSHLDILTHMVGTFHDEEGITSDEDHRRKALLPLLKGSPYGVIYLMGPLSSPLGYIAITFTWSLEFGGLDGTIEELYLRKKVRGRGIGTSAIYHLIKVLSQHGLKSLALEVDGRNQRALQFYHSTGFRLREHYNLMVMELV